MVQNQKGLTGQQYSLCALWIVLLCQFKVGLIGSD